MNQDLFFSSAFDKSQVINIATNTLESLDDGELYLEHGEYESLIFDNKVLKNASYNIGKGFGFRGVLGEITSFAHSNDFSIESLKKAKDTVISIKTATNPVITNYNVPLINHNLCSKNNPVKSSSFANRLDLLKKIDDYLRAKEALVHQVSISIGTVWKNILIVKKDGQITQDSRPMTSLRVSVVAKKGSRLEQGSDSVGGRGEYQGYIDRWQSVADEALRMALVNLESIPAKGGQMEVVLGNGSPGVMLHEAVGHGLEGDFNRKKTSVFSDLIGKQVAAKGVTVVDDGTIAARRGSLNFDDEGTPTKRNTLIEDGILVGYMQDRLNARLMNMEPTGNGRRESYAHQPMPRMTNTFMLSGKSSFEDIIAEVKNGVYAKNLGGGQVDITSGNFVFEVVEAYKIENGKITSPLKNVTLIGNGPEVMKKIKAIGNDSSLGWEGSGTCGKSGQSVPVGIGLPTILADNMTVGGTEV